MRMYQVIAVKTDRHALTGETDYVGRYLTLKQAQSRADLLWAEMDSGRNEYGIIGIEENEYEKNKYTREYEAVDHIRTYCKLNDGSWE